MFSSPIKCLLSFSKRHWRTNGGHPSRRLKVGSAMEESRTVLSELPLGTESPHALHSAAERDASGGEKHLKPAGATDTEAECKLEKNLAVHNTELYLVELNEEKRRVVRLILDGASLFIGGGAGFGKSKLLKTLIDLLKAKGVRVAVTASTGIAALNIGGNTFHSTFGVPCGATESSNVGAWPYSKVSYNRDSLRHLDVIIVDEISLLHSGYIEALDTAAREAPGNNPHLPFGGIQLVLSGDFMQLMCCNGGDTPVRGLPRLKNPARAGGSTEKRRTSRADGEMHGSTIKHKKLRSVMSRRTSFQCNEVRPIFESEIFLHCLIHVQLCQPARHQGDMDFLKDLEELRRGVLTKRMMRSVFLNPEQPNAIRLFPTRRSVATYNHIKMLELDGEECVFQSTVEIVKQRHDLEKAPTSETHAANSGSCNDVVVLYFRSKLIYMKNCHSLVNRLISGVGMRCGMADRFVVMMHPSVRRSLPFLKVYVHLLAAENKDGLDSMVAMKTEWKRTFHDDALTGKALLKLYGDVLFKVEQWPFVKDQLCGVLRREYIKNVERDSVLCTKRLKVGCKVMLLRNLNKDYVNGSTGKVTSFQPLSTAQHLLPADIRVRLSRKIYASLRGDQVDGDVDSSHSPVDKFSPHKGAEETRSGGTMDLVTECRNVVLPIVRMDSDGKEVAIPWLSMPIPGLRCGELELFRVVTMPLTPAYAFTVHKVQGLTLDHPVLLDCKGFFPCHHIIYVAASRVRRFSQLRMLNITRRMVTVHSGALNFSSSLPNVEEAETKWREWKRSHCTRTRSKGPLANRSKAEGLTLYCAQWKARSGE
uniref:ATP-dependent DNA helicase n=1 Tax=Trypanosoma congolense (strain IL3000) TaxID=1068625 RepID=G0V2W8_TRYCI|nr:unnamed protein product [Trypanosoma congolense IL3000]